MRARQTGSTRTAFVERAVEQALSEAKEPSESSGPTRGSVPSSGGVRSAAPAEQPGELLHSDTQYMDPRSAETVRGWVKAWRRMPLKEFQEYAYRLQPEPSIENNPLEKITEGELEAHLQARREAMRRGEAKRDTRPVPKGGKP